MSKRATTSKFKVGQEVELNSTSIRKTTAGTITAASVHLFSLPAHGNVIADTLYRVEVDNAYGVFGKSTRFVFERSIRRAVPARKAA